jgi:hypothetical protein
MRRNRSVRRKQRQTPLLLAALIERVDRLQPCLALAVVDLRQIQHVPIDHPAARQAPLLRNAPVAVLFAVLESSVAFQVHRNAERSDTLASRPEPRSVPAARYHGGRNLDSSPAPIDALPHVVDAAGKRLAVLVDSGFRRGSDVVKALALGAQAVLLGRATLYGIAAGGEAGAARAIGIFREEIDRVLALVGCRGIAELQRDCVWMPGDSMEIRSSAPRLTLSNPA